MYGHDSNNREITRLIAASLALVLPVLMIAVPAGSEARARIDVQTNPSRLQWSLFRRVDSIPDSSEDARIATEMSFPQPLRAVSVSAGYRLPSFTITVAPEREHTVVRRSAVLTEYLLRHEQGHYDIVVLAARVLARELEALTAPSGGELSQRTRQCVDEHTNRAKALSEAYDRETDRSRNPQAQARWLELIATAQGDPRTASLAGLPL